jgi:taurine dioxygenase
VSYQQFFPIPRRPIESQCYKTITVKPVAPAIGAEVVGVDLSKPIGDEQWNEIHQAFLRHLVLFFRGQRRLAPDEQIRFGRRFGTLHIHPAAPHVEGFPEVMIIRTQKDSKVNNGEDWHSDVSCDTEPPLGSILQIQLLPQCGGDTCFSNMYAAYDDLSAPMKSFLGGLVAVHESDHVYRGRYADQGVDDTGKTFPVAEHPLIRTHPETGKQCIFVNRIFTTRIKGLQRPESDALLQFLLRHVENPYYQYRFRWQENDVAVWDNRCAQHLAIWDYWPHERTGNRVTIQGDRPFFRA